MLYYTVSCYNKLCFVILCVFLYIVFIHFTHLFELSCTCDRAAHAWWPCYAGPGRRVPTTRLARVLFATSLRLLRSWPPPTTQGTPLASQTLLSRAGCPRPTRRPRRSAKHRHTSLDELATESLSHRSHRRRDAGPALRQAAPPLPLQEAPGRVARPLRQASSACHNPVWVTSDIEPSARLSNTSQPAFGLLHWAAGPGDSLAFAAGGEK
jgi:hypothetical protein